MQLKPASGLLELDAEIVAASKKEKYKIALKKRQKGMGDLNWVDFFEERNIKCGMERVSALIDEPRVGGSRVR